MFTLWYTSSSRILGDLLQVGNQSDCRTNQIADSDLKYYTIGNTVHNITHMTRMLTLYFIIV